MTACSVCGVTFEGIGSRCRSCALVWVRGIRDRGGEILTPTGFVSFDAEPDEDSGP